MCLHSLELGYKGERNVCFETVVSTIDLCEFQINNQLFYYNLSGLLCDPSLQKQPFCISHLIIKSLQRFILLGLACKVSCKIPPPLKPFPDCTSSLSLKHLYYSCGLNGITQLRVMYNVHTQFSEDCFMLNNFKGPLWLPP